MSTLNSEMSWSFRSLRRTPAFTVAVMLILGLGIGMATAAFSLFESVVLRKLPIPDPDRVAVLWPVDKSGTEFPLATDELELFRSRTRTIASIGGFAHWGAVEAAMAIGDAPVKILQAQVTGDFFTAMGAFPYAGRLLLPSDRGDGTEHVAVLSFAAWHRLYGGDPAIIGRQIKWLSADANHTIVGIAPPGLDYPVGTDIWIPMWPGMPLDLVARIAPGHSIEAARAEFGSFLLERAGQGVSVSVAGAHARSLQATVAGDVRPAFIAASLAAGILLLIACTNVGNLLLLRASERAREVAIRRAVGASRAALFRQFALESAMLAVGGGAIGIGVAALLLRLFVLVAPVGFPRVDMIHLDGSALLLGIAATLLTVLLTGLAPLLSARRGDVDGQNMRLDTRGGHESRGGRRLLRILVAGQVALALVVLSGSSLLIRSLARLETLSLGYGSERLAFVQVIPPPTQFYDDYAAWIRLADRALLAMQSEPGIVAASPLAAWPFTGANTFTTALEAEGAGTETGATTPIVSFDAVGPDFFRAMGLPLRRGRGFTSEDRAGTPPVAVVTETIAQRLWPGEDPIGRRFRFRGDTAADKWRTVVGVSGDLHFRDYRAATPTVFTLYTQLPFWQGTFAVRTTGDPSKAIRTITELLRRATPEMAIWRVDPMAAHLEAPLAQPRFNTMFLSAFGFAAVMLAGIGLFVVVSATVKQRHRELGIRVALGAAPNRLRRQVLGEAMVVVAAGGAIGVLGALATARLLAGLLFQVQPSDPIALIAASLALMLAGLMASYFPAKRVTEIDPVATLRGE